MLRPHRLKARPQSVFVSQIVKNTPEHQVSADDSCYVLRHGLRGFRKAVWCVKFEGSFSIVHLHYKWPIIADIHCFRLINRNRPILDCRALGTSVKAAARAHELA